jgi:hypothetical protein
MGPGYIDSGLHYELVVRHATAGSIMIALFSNNNNMQLY